MKDKSLSEILAWAESKVSDKSNTNIFVTIDDEGNMHVKKDGKEMDHMAHKMFASGDSIVHLLELSGSEAHLGPKAFFSGLHQESMSKDAANCVIKNINKVNTDSASRLL